MASWTSRFLNKQNSSFTLSYIIEGFTHVNSCIFCYTKRKRKKIRIFNCLSKIIFALGIRPYSLRGGGGGERGEGECLWCLCEDYDCVTVKIYLIPQRVWRILVIVSYWLSIFYTILFILCWRRQITPPFPLKTMCPNPPPFQKKNFPTTQPLPTGDNSWMVP